MFLKTQYIIYIGIQNRELFFLIVADPVTLLNGTRDCMLETTTMTGE